MTWVGIFLGLVLGWTFQSFNAAVILAALGGFIGYQLSRKGKPDSSDSAAIEEREATPAELQFQIRQLQQQMRGMQERMNTLERRLQSTSLTEAAEPSAVPQPPAPERQAASAKMQPETAQTQMPIQQPPVPMIKTAPVTEPPQAESNTTPPTSTSAPNPAEAVTPVPSATSIPTPAPMPAAAAAATTQADKHAEPRKRAVTTPPAEPSRLSLFIQRWVIGGNPLVKIGVLILFLGLAFLLRYVAEHTVVPVELRYAGVAAAGIGLLLFGWRWRHKQDNYGVILQGAGIGVLYLTTLAAMRLHPLIPPGFGFAILFGVAGFAALLAILQDALALAIVGSLFGFAAPVLASTGSANHVAFFSYLTLLNLGIVAIAWFKAWRILNLIGFGATFMLASAWGAKYYRPELFATCEPFLLLLFVLYVLIAFLFARRTLADAALQPHADFEEHVRRSVPHVSYVDGTLVFGVPFAAFGLQVLLVKHFAYGSAFSALGFGLAYVVLAFLLFRKSGMRYALLNETMIALAVIFGSLAIPLGLEEQWTSAAWAVEAAGVYWIGIRQQRIYARLFALLLLFGSAVYFALGVDVGGASSGHVVLDGSLLGCGMLAASLWFTYRLLRLADPQTLHGFEPALRPWLAAFGAFFIALMPFLLWPMEWAATALAILGTVAVYGAQRLPERSLLAWGLLYQAAAGALFLTTLQATADGAVLANGWLGLVAASLIGASMLAGAAIVIRAVLARTPPDANGEPGRITIGPLASLGLLAGLVFINLAPLFVLPWRFAAMVWPLTGIATLWWAVRIQHGGALGFALALQVVAGFTYLNSHSDFLLKLSASPAKPFLHSGFWGPCLIAIAALVCARLLQRRKEKPVDNMLGWITLSWGGLWWAYTWTSELVRVLPSDALVASLIGVTILSVWIWTVVARRLQWTQLGQATLAYVPALMLLATADLQSASAHPLASWGALAWPLALLAHFLLLRRQRAWVAGLPLDLAHIVGAWLFVAIAATELRWQFAHWTDAASSWPLLGWMIAPVLYLWSLSVNKLRRRWPLQDHADAYLLVSALPIALYLLGWVWVTNSISDGNASPLPYVPLLNPLELAQCAVLVCVGNWWWSLRTHPALAGTNRSVAALLGATAFVTITGMVARACHQLGGIAWHSDTLLASTLVQTSMSIVWSIVAIGLMLTGNRSRQRWIWIAGAALIAVVVAKLFLIELAARGSLARIVSFIVVGLLLLVVGYFAPLPPKRTDNATTDPTETSA